MRDFNRRWASRRTWLKAIAALGVGAGSAAWGDSHALAQAPYPGKPVTLVVPGPPGGITDQLGRLVAAKMMSDYDVKVIVENRPGAGGNVASEMVARAEPDGYTLLIGTQGTMATNQYLYKSLRFDPARDFVAAQGLISIPNILVVNSRLPYRSVQDLVTYAKAHPGKLTVSSAGNGTGTHLAAELFQAQAGVEFVHIPYKGSSPSISDLIGGQVDMTFDYPVSTLAQLDAGKLRALAVTGPTRLKLLPNVPTIAQAGYAGAESTSWIGLFFPARTPTPVTMFWQSRVGAMLVDPTTIEKIQNMGGVPLPLAGDRFASFIATERVKWKATIQRAGATID